MRTLFTRLATIVLLGLVALLPCRTIQAAAPSTLNYDGSLTMADGRPLSTGRYDFRFALYTSPTGGEPIWIELHSKVQVNGGAFHAVLGKGSPAVALELPFDQQYYLGVSVDGGPELQPRVELMPTPYSFHARRAEQVSDNSVTSEKLAPGSVTDEKIRSVSWSKITGVNGNLGVPSEIWSLKGNSNSNPGSDFLGTTDGADLVFRTNNAPRFSIRAGGEGQFLSDFDAFGRITSRPSSSSGAFLFGDQSVGLERPAASSDLRLFGPALGSFVFDGGNVGIGVWHPSSKLEVGGRTTLRENLEVDGRADVAGAAGVGGSLTVGGGTFLQDVLRVTGATTIQASLTATGAASLGSSLVVVGATRILDATESGGSGSGALVVGGGVGIGKSLRVGQDFTVSGTSTFTGPMQTVGGGSFGALEVSGNATIGGVANADRLIAGPGGLESHGPSGLNGQVIVNANLDANGDNTVPAAYPLRVQGSSQGIMIEVNGAEADGRPNKSNNFVSFYGSETNRIHGRISGLTDTENQQEGQYKWQKASLIIQSAVAGLDIVTAGINLFAAISATTACVGIGACVTVPIPSLIIAAIAEGVTALAGATQVGGDFIAWQSLQNKLTENGGVTYSSASADYAEWLPKLDPHEPIFAGDIVGVFHGRVTKRTAGADMLMVASTRPLVLGNTPPEGRESEYVKVAFMGQVPVKVFGRVELGDYLVPSGNDNGFGIALRPRDLTAADLARVAGVAWAASKSSALDYVNTAVGLDRASIAQIADQQEVRLRAQASEIDDLRRQLQRTNVALARLVPGFEADLPGSGAISRPSAVPSPVQPSPAPAAVAFAEPPATVPLTATPGGPLVSRYDVELGIKQAIENLLRSGATPENSPILRQLMSPNIVEEMREKLQASLSAQLARGR